MLIPSDLFSTPLLGLPSNPTEHSLTIPRVATLQMFKPNLIWEAVEIVLIPDVVAMEICHSSLLLLGVYLTDGPSCCPFPTLHHVPSSPGLSVVGQEG